MGLDSNSAWGKTIQNELSIELSNHGTHKEPGKRLTRAAIEKKDRRKNAKKKWRDILGGDILQRRFEARLERLERTNPNDALPGYEDTENDRMDDNFEVANGSDSEFDFSDDDDEDETYTGSKDKPEKKKTNATKSSKGAKRSGKQAVSTKNSSSHDVNTGKKPSLRNSQRERSKKKDQPSKRRVRSLEDILLDENSRKILAAKHADDIDTPDYLTARAPKSRYPPRKICVVSGALAKYKDPDTGLPFRNVAAYDQLKELPPPWFRASATTIFYDSLRIMDQERAKARDILLVAEMETTA